ERQRGQRPGGEPGGTAPSVVRSGRQPGTGQNSAGRDHFAAPGLRAGSALGGPRQLARHDEVPGKRLPEAAPVGGGAGGGGGTSRRAVRDQDHRDGRVPFAPASSRAVGGTGRLGRPAGPSGRGAGSPSRAGGSSG